MTKKETCNKQLVDFDLLPDSALVRLPQIVGALIPVSRATWWRYVKVGKAPAPVKVSDGVTAWRVGELRAWLAQEVL
jgi:predicted DNA-binding transcriptional regulator AlpA